LRNAISVWKRDRRQVSVGMPIGRARVQGVSAPHLCAGRKPVSGANAFAANPDPAAAGSGRCAHAPPVSTELNPSLFPGVLAAGSGRWPGAGTA
jgi:hypothetical protein